MGKVFDFPVVEAQIQGAASVGQLVPFIGAGISVPLCRPWLPFLEALNQGLGIPNQSLRDSPDPGEIYRMADRAAFALRLLSHEERRKCIAEALVTGITSSRTAMIPNQATALAAGFWPLVVTTNYDDVYIKALNGPFPRLLGRNSQDCEEIVRSLDITQRPILWCIQGFVGFVAHKLDPPSLKSKLPTLIDEVVIGHQQYQAAANRNLNFRRSFAELYRRKSILFVGSGLAESYFVNLISEIILSYGPGPKQHYALFCDEELCGSRTGRSPIDTEFLEVRLGILPVRYGSSWADLPATLARVAPIVGPRAPRAVTSDSAALVLPRSFSYEIPRRAEFIPTLVATEISVRFTGLQKAELRQCIVISVGLGRSGSRHIPLVGGQGEGLLKDHYPREFEHYEEHRQSVWSQIGERCFRFVVKGAKLPIFAVAARDPSQENADRRSLIAVEEATEEALSIIEGLNEFTSVLIGALAAGDSRFAFPTFTFIAQLNGIRRFVTQRPASIPNFLKLVENRVVDPRVIGPIVDGRLPVRETLTSNMVRVLIRVSDVGGSWEAHTVMASSNTTIRDVLTRYPLDLRRASVDAWPLPYPNYLGKADVLDAPVFPMMTIEIKPHAKVD